MLKWKAGDQEQYAALLSRRQALAKPAGIVYFKCREEDIVVVLESWAAQGLQLASAPFLPLFELNKVRNDRSATLIGSNGSRSALRAACAAYAVSR